MSADDPFVQVTARGVEGLSGYRLRQLPAPTRGVRLTSTTADAEDRARAMLAPVRATAVVTDLSAARLWSLPLPWWLDDGREPLSIAVTPGSSHTDRRGMRGRRLRLPTEHVTELHRIRVTTPARTWLDCAAFLPPIEVLALGDAVLHAGLASLDELRALTHWGFRRRGVARCRQVLELLDPGAESPGESRIRFALMAAGIRRPRCNVDVFDAFGAWLARGDLVWEDERLIVEYDGQVHLPEDQRRRDAQRRNRLLDAGWYVITVTAADLRTPWVIAGQVSRALAARGRPR